MLSCLSPNAQNATLLLVYSRETIPLTYSVLALKLLAAINCSLATEHNFLNALPESVSKIGFSLFSSGFGFGVTGVSFVLSRGPT